MYVLPKVAAKHYNVSTETLRIWGKEGKISFIRTDGGHRRYKINKKIENEKRIIYARVSSHKQSEDLQRQIEYLRKKYPNTEIISDIGSGLNYKRKGFRKILEQLFEGNISEVIISSSDRFSRFGTKEFFGWLFEQFGARLTILEDTSISNSEEELSRELLEVITVFTAKYYGKRCYSNN